MKRAIITGGGGFVGQAIVKILLGQGVECVVIGRSRYVELEKLKVRCLQGDIGDRDFIFRHVRDCDVVFHVAALAGIWGNWHDYKITNIDGTRNIIDACLRNGVSALVYTSTPSVVFAGKDIAGGNEDLPHARRFLTGYAKSKSLAEQKVLSVDQSVLRTCAIRPHLIWGPGDPHLIPRLLDRGRKGKLKRVGDGSNMVDISYIDNVGHAHWLAALNLLSSATAKGKAYFIGQERPVRLWDWIDELFQRLGIPSVKRQVPFPAAWTAGAVLEGVHSIFLAGQEPMMTRFLAEQLAKSHYFSHENSRRDLGYRAIVSIEEGMDRLIHRIQSYEKN